MLGAACVLAAESRPSSGLPVPPKPRDLHAATGMPRVLTPSMATANRATSSGPAQPTDANDPRAKAVREKSPIPDGYIRAQASADWRGQSAAWYREQAQTIVGRIKSVQPKAQIAGVAIVDQDTGDILQLIGVGELTSSKTGD